MRPDQLGVLRGQAWQTHWTDNVVSTLDDDARDVLAVGTQLSRRNKRGAAQQDSHAIHVFLLEELTLLHPTLVPSGNCQCRSSNPMARPYLVDEEMVLDPGESATIQS